MSFLNRFPFCLILALAIGAFPVARAADAKTTAPSVSGTTGAALSAVDAGDLALFERKATLAKRLGATHVPLTDGLPVAKWQYQPLDDPYPAWFIQRPDFLKLFPPAEVQPYVDTEYGH